MSTGNFGNPSARSTNPDPEEIALALLFGRELPEFPGYLIAPWGAVYSNRRGSWWRLGQSLRGKKGARDLGIMLQHIDGTRHAMLVHRLVLLAFTGPPANSDMQARHWDDDPQSNVHGNLLWGNATENRQDLIRNGRIPRGERLWKAKLTEADVRTIRTDYAEGAGNTITLAKRFQVGTDVISRIINYKAWSHVQ